MRIIIRDDDCNCFTKFNQIENAYRSLWLKGIPVCLSVVPSILSHPSIGHSGRPMNKHITNRQYSKCKNFPITDNRDLCRKINHYINSGLIEIAVHGFSHDVDEFNTTYSNASTLINMGRNILLEAFPSAKISTFVAPYDQLSKDAVQAILDAGFNICTSYKKLVTCGFFELKPSLSTIFDHEYNKFYKISNQFILTSDKFFYYENLGSDKSLENFNKITEDSIQSENRILVCTNHYWQFYEYTAYVLKKWH